MSIADGGGVQVTDTEALSGHFALGVPSETDKAILKVPAVVHVNVAPMFERLLSVPEVADHVAASGDGPLSGSCDVDVSCTELPT